MADSETSNYSWTKPEVTASQDTWGDKWNANLDEIDDVLAKTDTQRAPDKADLEEGDFVYIRDAADGDKLKKVPRAAISNVSFPPGTRMLFHQTAAPVGWTKDVSIDNKALRVTSGSVSSGGTIAFSDCFKSRSISGSITPTTAGGSVGGTALTVAHLARHRHSNGSLTVPNHAHGNGGLYVPSFSLKFGASFIGAGIGSTGGYVDAGGSNVSTRPSGNLNVAGSTAGSGTLNVGGLTEYEGSGSPHGHPFTGQEHSHNFNGNNIDLSVQYVDIIIAEKD